MTQPLKEKPCKQCERMFLPRNTLQRTCSIPCSMADNRERQNRKKKREAEDRRKAEARRLKQRKEALKSKSDWAREAQAAFNAWVRARDHGKPCVSCGTTNNATALTGGYWDCGHYRSRGAASHLRFNAFNAARQCKQCNRQLSGNIVDYRKGLLMRIGSERLERLECDNTPRKFDIDYYKRVKRIFNERTRLCKRIKGIA